MKKISINNLKNGDIILFHSNTGCFAKCIQCCTRSEFCHIGLVLKNPVYINPSLNNGLYLLESGQETLLDIEDHTHKLGVQIQPLFPILQEYGLGNVYCRQLNSYIPFPKQKMREIHEKIHNKPYDLNIVDWAEAMVDAVIENGTTSGTVPIFNKNTSERFWCSALVTFVYINLGYLPNQTYWSLTSPENWNNKKFFSFQNCTVGPVKKVIF